MNLMRVDTRWNRLRMTSGDVTYVDSAYEVLADWFRPREWVADALCAQTDPEVFFPSKGESAQPAKRICARCPVRAACRADAIANGETDGIWGGTSPKNRRASSRDLEVAA